eukprot:TRINITY_DN1806_c0_g2_i1.p1 TRINITY_DN1806_c0_g2~~TRINITY_DN1806_c0_g2_i1.p1  ORF type:complete len:260 (+),score=42.53 TRINITY_DN1806_c0_g2_i1:66-782(+)
MFEKESFDRFLSVVESGNLRFAVSVMPPRMDGMYIWTIGRDADGGTTPDADQEVEESEGGDACGLSRLLSHDVGLYKSVTAYLDVFSYARLRGVSKTIRQATSPTTDHTIPSMKDIKEGLHALGSSQQPGVLICQVQGRTKASRGYVIIASPPTSGSTPLTQAYWTATQSALVRTLKEEIQARHPTLPVESLSIDLDFTNLQNTTGVVLKSFYTHNSPMDGFWDWCHESLRPVMQLSC